MKWLQTAWPHALAYSGMAIVWTELALWATGVRTPSDVLTALALGMMFPTAQTHVKTIFGSPGPPSSSSPPPPSPPSPPSPSREVGSGERAAG